MGRIRMQRGDALDVARETKQAGNPLVQLNPEDFALQADAAAMDIAGRVARDLRALHEVWTTAVATASPSERRATIAEGILDCAEILEGVAALRDSPA